MRDAWSRTQFLRYLFPWECLLTRWSHFQKKKNKEKKQKYWLRLFEKKMHAIDKSSDETAFRFGWNFLQQPLEEYQKMKNKIKTFIIIWSVANYQYLVITMKCFCFSYKPGNVINSHFFFASSYSFCLNYAYKAIYMLTCIGCCVRLWMVDVQLPTLLVHKRIQYTLRLLPCQNALKYSKILYHISVLHFAWWWIERQQRFSQFSYQNSLSLSLRRTTRWFHIKMRKIKYNKYT